MEGFRYSLEIATNTPLLASDACGDWLCLDPDAQRVDAMRRVKLPANCRIACGTITDVPAHETFGSILCLDVHEHIDVSWTEFADSRKDDRGEIAAARDRLLPCEPIVVLAPAHQFLYSPFDAKFGHYRRYDRRSLVSCGAQGLSLEAIRYLDCVGLAAPQIGFC